jgi:putative solute:sodium symporter small subunit
MRNLLHVILVLVSALLDLLVSTHRIRGSSPKGGVMQLTEKHNEYWHRNLVITGVLLLAWFIVTFVEAWYARELNEITFFGFPLGFYMSAQGSLAIYVVIIGIYALLMRKLDLEYKVDEGDLE